MRSEKNANEYWQVLLLRVPLTTGLFFFDFWASDSVVITEVQNLAYALHAKGDDAQTNSPFVYEHNSWLPGAKGMRDLGIHSQSLGMQVYMEYLSSGEWEPIGTETVSESTIFTLRRKVSRE